MDSSQAYLDPKILARIKDLELKARRIIEGMVSGIHKSPFQGTSIEFAEHRQYVPGDDIRHIDWKLFGKTERFYLKLFEQETNLVCNLVFDASESMNYTSGGETKFDYSATLVACLAYLLLQRRDSVGAVFMEDKIRYLLNPASQPTHLKQVLHLLGVCKPANLRSRIGDVLDDLATRLRKRSLVVVVSDMFDDLTKIEKGLKHLRYKRHEVIVFQVLDPAEISFPFKDLTKFIGLESLPEVMVDPRGIRKAYQKEFGSYLKSLAGICRSMDVDYERITTDQPLGQFLAKYLSTRAA